MKTARTTTCRLATVTLTAAILGVVGFGSIARAEDMTKHEATMKTAPADAMKKGDLIDVATGANMESVTTLVAAIKAAGLVDALKGEGPFTVFAPTNEAFAKLPAGTVEDLLKPENKEKLQKILKFHVVPGKVMAADVKTMSADTAAGEKAEVVVKDGVVTYGGQKVIKTDIVASNGVIHWIDGVAMPKM